LAQTKLANNIFVVLTPGTERAKSLKAKESGKTTKNHERTTGSFMKTIDSLRVF
jgi:hypothetical protein